LAKVVIPENIASAVTDEGIRLTLTKAGAVRLTFPVDTTIYGLWKFDIFKGYLVVVVGLNANQNRQQGEGRDNLWLHGKYNLEIK